MSDVDGITMRLSAIVNLLKEKSRNFRKGKSENSKILPILADTGGSKP